jgi:hypothetical protein
MYRPIKQDAIYDLPTEHGLVRFQCVQSAPDTLLQCRSLTLFVSGTGKLRPYAPRNGAMLDSIGHASQLIRRVELDKADLTPFDVDTVLQEITG